MNDLSQKFPKRSAEDHAHQAALALKAGKLGSFEWNIVTDECVADPHLAALFNLPNGPRTGTMVLDSVHPDDRETLNTAIEKTLVDNVDYDTAFRVGTCDDFIWIGGRGRVVERDADGNAMRMMGVNWDMTQAKKAEERQIALTREMDHRVNNGYAIIEAIVAIGAEEYENLADFSGMLRTQLHALSAAHQLASETLLHVSADTRVLGLSDVIRRALRLVPHQHLKAELAGSPMISPQNVAAVSMLFHHICMGAIKGVPVSISVSQPLNGMVDVIWINGDGAKDGAPGTPDFLFSLCLEQLNGAMDAFVIGDTGQYIRLSLPVIVA